MPHRRKRYHFFNDSKPVTSPTASTTVTNSVKSFSHFPLRPFILMALIKSAGAALITIYEQSISSKVEYRFTYDSSQLGYLASKLNQLGMFIEHAKNNVLYVDTLNPITCIDRNNVEVSTISVGIELNKMMSDADKMGINKAAWEACNYFLNEQADWHKLCAWIAFISFVGMTMYCLGCKPPPSSGNVYLSSGDSFSSDNDRDSGCRVRW